MFKHGWCVPFAAAVVFVSMVAGCGESAAPVYDLAAINFETTSVPAGGAGQLYNTVIQFTTSGGAAPPDQFEVDVGVLPPGVELSRDREDNDFDGLPDEDGAYTGHARLLGYPREAGTYLFVIKAISTGELAGLAQNGDLPALAASAEFTVTVGEGSVSILSPTAAEGTTDPAVPAFPEVINYVNPANPQAFFSYSFLIAGGSTNNINVVYVPRELELSSFDAALQLPDGDPNKQPGNHDTDESQFGASDKQEAYTKDGGLFSLQAGNSKMQVGGFQSPRGRVYNPSDPGVGGIDQHGDPQAPTPGYDPDWFQRAPGYAHTSLGGESFTVPPQNSRRDLNDTLGLAGGDTTLGTPQPVQFSDYFSTVTVTKNDDGVDITPFEHPIFEGTYEGFVDPAFGPQLKRRKYPFTSDQYFNAFFVPYVDGVDLTPLKFRLIAEAIDTRGTGTPTDDVIARKAFIAQVKIPDIVIDTVVLPAGQAGVDYTAVVVASGGVPPLSYELEYVDGNGDGVADPGDALTKEMFGIDLDVNTAYFFGVPRASSATAGGVDLTVRVYGAVMGPVQAQGNPPPPVPTGNPNEFDGALFPGGESGRHKTYTVFFAPPSTPYVVTAALPSGVDGLGYNASVDGGGGVPRLVPYPVGFVGTYPSGTVARAYEWDAHYDLDASHPDPVLGIGNEGDTVVGLPNALTLVADPLAATNGQISGINYDRGLHKVSIDGKDDYVGDGTAPMPTPLDSPPGLGGQQTPFSRVLDLSVGPDQAVYLRGDQSAAGTPSGLLDDTAQMTEARMVPMFQSAGIFATNANGQAQLFDSSLPTKIDLLPILLPNGGSDAHNRKSIPSISGFWPAESGSEWCWMYEGLSREYGWNHLQQETVWAQAPNAAQSRVFLWAETSIKKFGGSGATNSGYAKRYQQYLPSGKRGVLVLQPTTGKYFVPAILTNNNTAHGSQFGAECVVGAPSRGSYNYNYYGGVYWRYYYYNGGTSYDTMKHDRDLHNQSLGSYLEPRGTSGSTTTGYYLTVQGRTGVSLAMSADGIWCATAMPGGSNTQKILLFRTDGQPIPPAILSQSYVTGLNGIDTDGSTLTNSACIIYPGGQNASGHTIENNQRYLLPDSLMFVDGGLLFLNERDLDYVFGFSLADGELSSRYLNSRSSVNGAGTGYSVNYLDGQFIPDNDWLRGMQGGGYFSVQFSFTGNKPAVGSAGPDKVAFVAGDNRFLYAFTDLSAQARDGYMMCANGYKSLLFLEVDPTRDDLDLGDSSTTLKDLTGNTSLVYGDLLTPGRPGEEQDWCTVSDSGDYVAVVREYGTSYTDYGGYGYVPTFQSYYSSASSYYAPQHDLMLISTKGVDMDSGTNGTQHVLFIGTRRYSATTSNPSMPAWATGRSYIYCPGRRVNGVTFGSDDRTLIWNYSGHSSYSVNYTGSAYQYRGINPGAYGTSSYNGCGTQLSLRLQFRTSTDGPINFASTSSSGTTAYTNMKNNLQGLTGIGAIGSTSLRFYTTNSSVQCFWATFKSANGDFLYFIVDQVSPSASHGTGTPAAPTKAYRNYMVGFNTSNGTINGHAPYVPFSPHSDNVGFEQFDVNSFNYENRFASVPGGVSFEGRDGAGILCVIGCDASTGAVSDTDLEVYAMDADIGSDLFVLTSDVTTGTANAINYIQLSTDGNVLVGHRSATAVNSRSRRDQLTGHSDLFVVTNVHEVLSGGTPNAIVVSADQSHGSSVALMGDGSGSRPFGIVYSSADAGNNTTWAERTLKLVPLVAGANPTTLDDVESHYVVLAGDRTLDDEATTSD